MSMSSIRRLGLSTNFWGDEVVAIAATLGQGADQDCRKVKIRAEASKTVYMGNASPVDNTHVLVPNDEWLEMEITNTNLLHFFGTNGDKVYILWFN